MSAGPVPRPDHAAALDWAASFREFRSSLQSSLGGGSRTLSDVLAASAGDAFLAETKLLAVLEALPGARKTDTRRALDALGIAHGTRLGTLTDGQRAALLATFPLGRTPAAQEAPTA